MNQYREGKVKRTPVRGVKDSAVSGLFHSPSGVLFTFPSRYWFTIGGQEYLALEGGPPRFPQDFTCPVVLNNIVRSPTRFAYRTITFFGRPFQVHSAWDRVFYFLLTAEARADECYNPQQT